MRDMKRLQIVYVVTFSEDNYCFEQALLSICSARIYHPDADILVVTGPVSGTRIDGWRKRALEEYHCQVLVADVPETFDMVERSRFLKTNLRELVEGDYLFIDTDTIICRPLYEVTENKGDVCAVLDRHVRWHENEYIIFADQRFKQAGFHIANGESYFNSGVMYVRDTPVAHEFYQEWSALWRTTLDKGIYFDQLSMHQANVNCGHVIREMDGKWNCQLGGLFLNYLHRAYIIHYYANSNKDKRKLYKFKYEETYLEVRKHQGVTPELKDAIQHPYEQFYNNYIILNGWTLDLYESCNPCINLCNESPHRFAIINRLARWLRKTYKR